VLWAVACPGWRHRSALIDSGEHQSRNRFREHGDDHRVWLKLYYDPVVSYAERIREQLLFLAIHRRPVSTRTESVIASVVR